MDGVKSAAEKLVDLKKYVIMGTLLASDGNRLKNIQTKLDWGAGCRVTLIPSLRTHPQKGIILCRTALKFLQEMQ